MTPEAKTELEKPLDRKHVAQREKGGQQLSYVEGWHVIAEANRIFGFDGWMRELIDLTENTTPTTNSRGNAVVSFRARVRVTVGDIVREGTGFGSGVAKDIHDAYESAIKEAETDAMKRAFMTFGNPFGLALYNKSQANVVSGYSAAFQALCENMAQQTMRADALAWAEKQKPEIERLPAEERDEFRLRFNDHLKSITPKQVA